MVKGLIGRKLGMSQINDGKGRIIPVTVLRAGPCVVVQKKSKSRDGYDAVQLGLVEPGLKTPIKPIAGHLKKSGAEAVRMLREFRASDPEAVPDVGGTIDVGLFDGADRVDVVGRSRGIGFTGVIKRYNFGGGRATHGSMFHRAPGSIGASAYPSRVYPGTKMPGRKGNDRITVRNLEVVRIDKENNLLVVRGAVPGPRKALVLICKSRTGKAAKSGGS
jgi:large subunit ribosomal protein L3